jgi:Fur family transcriptional regulator, ferric uptake regulator
MDKPENTIQHMLQESGLRATTQRRTVLEVVTTHQGPLTAEDIYREAQQINPRISLATVYRTLTSLTDAGVLGHSYLTRDHERSHFELAGASDTFHFHCLMCGKIIEFQSRPVLSALRKELADKYGAEVTGVCLCTDGYCKACADSRRKAAPEAQTS